MLLSQSHLLRHVAVYKTAIKQVTGGAQSIRFRGIRRSSLMSTSIRHKSKPSIMAPYTRMALVAVPASTKNVSERAFVRTQNINFGSFFVPERCCAASVLKVNHHISDRFS